VKLPRNRFCGVTLIELLVALLIFGIFSVLAYAGLMRLLDSRARLADEQRVWQTLSQVFSRISDDVAHARSRTVRDASGFTLPAFVGRPFDPRALAEPSLEMTRGGELNYGKGVQSDLRRVAYRLKEGRLVRLTWPVLDRGPVTAPLEAPLLDGVETFELRYQGASGAAPDKGGGGAPPDTWPPAGRIDDLPRAVEVTLAVKGVGSFKRLFVVNR
jgi:general secretion pathway protein J